LTVVEEAHNFIPSKGEGQSETPSVEIIRRVITEGRKFGVGLLLVSQRPSRLDETTLSQCNSFLILRLVNPRDQQFVEKVMENLSRADGRLLPAFGPGEGIVSGQAVRFPLVVRIKFDDDLVTSTIGDEDFVKAVQTWENSSRGDAHARSEELEAALNAVDGGRA
jgi:DNA helicase HerA-like ATPase